MRPVQRLLFPALLLCAAACGGSSHSGGDHPSDAAPGRDGASDAASADAPAVTHTGGWRMRGGDATHGFRSSAAGPGATATSTLFAQNTSGVEFASLGTPVIDEHGNLYFASSTPMVPTDLVSLDPAGNERWRTSLEAGWSPSDLALGPDGNVYAVATTGSGDTMQGKIVGFRASDGTALPGSAPIAGLWSILMPPGGGLYAMTYTTAAGYGMQAFDSIGHSRWTLTKGGDQYALSPAGDAFAVIVVGAGNPAPPLELDVLAPSDGHELWHYTFAAGLGTPALAFDTDGSIYASASENGSNLHVLKLSSDGQLVYDRTISTLTWPSRIVVGASAIAIGAQNGQDFAGIALQKSDGMPPPNASTPCGDPQAIDSADEIFWSCNNGIESTTPAGAVIGSWTGQFTFQIVLGPDGTAYDVPAAYFAAMQLYRIK